MWEKKVIPLDFIIYIQKKSVVKRSEIYFLALQSKQMS